MNIAIMQPYLYPYIGYFQLIYASDVFVFYDDVHYMNGLWINRNRVLVNGADHLFTIPCQRASQNKLIKDVKVFDDPRLLRKLLSTFQMAYAKAPYFKSVFPIIENTLKQHQRVNETVASIGSPFLESPDTFSVNLDSISSVAISSVMTICQYLGIKRTFKLSSVEYDNRELKSADRLIDICYRENICDYVNGEGGKRLYNKEYFASKGISLKFHNTGKIQYKQYKNDFIPLLSIIDVLMFNSREQVISMLEQYEID